MITPEYVRQMALYNRWQNENLYDRCGSMAPTERLRDRGMFFRSIHHTLDHIAMIDRAILHMLETGVRSSLEFDRLHFPDFHALHAERVRIDAQLTRLADEHDSEWLANKASPSFRFVRGFMLTQLFNHQTHHRSQVTSELHKLGIDYGCTDMPYNPYLQP